VGKDEVSSFFVVFSQSAPLLLLMKRHCFDTVHFMHNNSPSARLGRALLQRGKKKKPVDRKMAFPH
jgi:hypothetical protein